MTRVEIFDNKLRRLRAEISDTVRRRQKAKARRKVDRTMRGRGRPTLSAETIALAWELAKDFPIPVVAAKLDVGKSSLHRYGITRQAIEEKQRQAEQPKLMAA